MAGLKLFLILLSFASAQNASAEGSPYVLCKNAKVVRTLRVDTENGRCQTIYTKIGKDKVIGSGQHLASCHKFLEDVKDNLTEAGWKCREAQQASVSELGGEMASQ